MKNKDVLIGVIIIALLAAGAGIIYALTRKPTALVTDPAGKLHIVNVSDMNDFIKGVIPSNDGTFYNPAGTGTATYDDGSGDVSIDSFLAGTGGSGSVDNTLLAGDPGTSGTSETGYVDPSTIGDNPPDNTDTLIG